MRRSRWRSRTAPDFTDNLPGYRAALVDSGFAAVLAEMIELVWEHGGSVVAGDSVTLDGAGRVAWERVASETPDAYQYGGRPEGRTFTALGETLVLVSQACRVPVPSVAPREAPDLVEVGARVI